jgi:hypothetical protein
MPGHGDRPRTAEDEQPRADLRRAMAAGDTERFESISVRYGAANLFAGTPADTEEESARILAAALTSVKRRARIMDNDQITMSGHHVIEALDWHGVTAEWLQPHTLDHLRPLRSWRTRADGNSARSAC